MPSQPKGYVRSKTRRVLGGYRPPGDPPEAVAADDVIALQHVLAPLVPEADAGPLALRPLHRQRLGLEQQRAALLELEGDEVLADLRLGVDHHRPAAGEGGEVDPVAAPARTAARSRRAAAPPGPSARPAPAARSTSTVPCSRIPARWRCSTYGPVAALQHDGVDARVVQQPRQQQAGRPGADDSDGRTHPARPFVFRSTHDVFAVFDSAARLLLVLPSLFVW